MAARDRRESQKLRLRLECRCELRQAFPNLRFGPRCESKGERGLQLRFNAEEGKGSWSDPDFAGTPEDEWEVCFSPQPRDEMKSGFRDLQDEAIA